MIFDMIERAEIFIVVCCCQWSENRHGLIAVSLCLQVECAVCFLLDVWTGVHSLQLLTIILIIRGSS